MSNDNNRVVSTESTYAAVDALGDVLQERAYTW